MRAEITIKAQIQEGTERVLCREVRRGGTSLTAAALLGFIVTPAPPGRGHRGSHASPGSGRGLSASAPLTTHAP